MYAYGKPIWTCFDDQPAGITLALPQLLLKTVQKAQNKKPNKTKLPQMTKKAEKELKDALSKSIERSNKGFEMLVKMGYEEGKGLGKTGDGMVEPLSIELKTDRKGLGAKKIVKPVTTEEVGKNVLSRGQKRRLRQKAAKEAIATANAPKSLQSVTNVTKLETTEQPIVNKKVEEKSSTELPTTKRKHSPIRAPTPPTTPSAKVNAKAIQDKMPKSTKEKQHKVLKFRLKDATTPQQLQQIAQHFRDDIELLQLRLAAEATLNADAEQYLIVAKIVLGTQQQQQPIAPHIFEYIRMEIVAWIGWYQHQEYATPIFHSMTNNKTDITVICENTYAYECLQQCMEAVTRLRKLTRLLVLRLPHISKLLYCFGVVYAGIIIDPQLFLTQVKLHKTTLKADRWIPISHEICATQRQTHFMFLLDEPSALALTYHYNSKLFICMQMVEFTNRGCLPHVY